MTRLPVAGGDDNVWGAILNDYLSQSHDSNGNLKSGIVGAANIADNSIGDTQVLSLSQSKITGLSSALSSKADTSTVVHKGDLLINIKDYGAVGDGVADDTAAIQSAIDAAVAIKGVVWISGTCLLSGASGSSALSCNGSNVLITGTGTLVQAPGATNFNLLSMSGSVNCRIEGITFIGRTGTLPASSNNGIYALGTSGLTIRDCKFTGILNRPTYIVNGADVKIEGCDAWACSNGYGYNSTFRSSFNDCVLRDPQVPVTGVFVCGFTLESSFSGPSGSNHVPCQNITMTGCRVKSLANAQSVLVHAGKYVTITGNIFEDAQCAISINPFSATDVTQYITVTGNTCIGTSTSQSYTVTDGVLNGTTTLVSATAAFGTWSLVRTITGTGIPAGTTISSVTNATTVILSNAATTTASGVAITIGTIANVASYGITVGGAAGLVSISCTRTASSAILTTAASFTASGLVPGMQIVGTGIPSNVQVLSVDSATSLTMTAPASASGTSSLSFFTCPQNVNVSGNTVTNFNAVVQNVGASGIGIGYSAGVICSSNNISGCYANGISVINPVTDVIISGNQIDNVRIVNGVNQVGILMYPPSAGSSGYIGANLIDGGASLLSGIRADGLSGNMNLLADNTYMGNVVNKVTNVNNFAAYAEGSHILSPNPPVSGTIYRNNVGLMGNCMVFLPAYASTPGTAGTVDVSVTITNAVSNVFTQVIAGTTTSTQPGIVIFVVPPGHYWTVTLTGVTLGAGYAQRM